MDNSASITEEESGQTLRDMNGLSAFLGQMPDSSAPSDGGNEDVYEDESLTYSSQSADVTLTMDDGEEEDSGARSLGFGWMVEDLVEILEEVRTISGKVKKNVREQKYCTKTLFL